MSGGSSGATSPQAQDTMSQTYYAPWFNELNKNAGALAQSQMNMLQNQITPEVMQGGQWAGKTGVFNGGMTQTPVTPMQQVTPQPAQTPYGSTTYGGALSK
jgi:hypothetical protein